MSTWFLSPHARLVSKFTPDSAGACVRREDRRTDIVKAEPQSIYVRDFLADTLSKPSTEFLSSQQADHVMHRLQFKQMLSSVQVCELGGTAK